MSKLEKIIRVHFTGRDTLELHGKHVIPFFESYKRALNENAPFPHFASEDKDKIIINMSQVTFIEETHIEIGSEGLTDVGS